MTGDVFRSVGYPNIDRTNGGTLKGMLESLNLLVGAGGTEHDGRPRPRRESPTARPSSPTATWP